MSKSQQEITIGIDLAATSRVPDEGPKGKQKNLPPATYIEARKP
jgi:hypothetical protein